MRLWPATLLLALSLATSLGCDKKTAVESPQPTSATPAPAPTGAQERRFSDLHTHLNPFSYRLFFQTTADLGLHRIVNMSGGSEPEARLEHLRFADEEYGRVALFHNPDWSRMQGSRGGALEADALRASVAAGFAGLKISKALGLGVRTEDDELLPVDDPRLDPLWTAAAELGVPVAIHTADPRAFFEKPGPQNERHAELSLAPGWSFYGEQFPSREELLAQRDRLIARHPETTFILLHFANNPEDVDYVDRLLEAHDNVYVDVAARIGEIGRHDPARVREIFLRHQDRVFFATDIQMSVFPTPERKIGYRVTLGSISEKPPSLDDIAPFYQSHFRYFESDGEPIAHPVPIQGDWKVNPVALPPDVLEKLYWKNAERVVFAPWLGRRAAVAAVQIAERLTSAAPPAESAR